MYRSLFSLGDQTRLAEEVAKVSTKMGDRVDSFWKSSRVWRWSQLARVVEVTVRVEVVEEVSTKYAEEEAVSTRIWREFGDQIKFATRQLAGRLEINFGSRLMRPKGDSVRSRR